MEEADGDRLDTLAAEVVEDGGEFGEVERGNFLSFVGQPATGFATQIARHEGRRLFVVEVEEIRPVATRDLETVTKPLGGDEPDLDALALGQRVDDDRCAMREEVDLGRCHATLADDVEHALLEIGRCGVGLRSSDYRLARCLIGLEHHEVRESASDVGRNADRLGRHGSVLG